MHTVPAHREAEELLRDADIAMYQAKRSRTGGYSIFKGEMYDAAVDALDLHVDLQNAILRREFILHYQPIYQLNGTVITGFEALIRWLHPTRGLVSPGSFIPDRRSGRSDQADR